MEYNIERSSSVSMFKKQRKLDDGKVVWDSVVKLRKKNPAQCRKYPKNHLGIRNSWIKEFSGILSDKASSYILETMSAERTSRQEEIAQTLLNRFNDVLEQEASMKDPQTLTHKAMVMMADKLSLWLDKNVKVSKKVGVRLRQIEEKEKKKRLMEEMERLEQERRDREEEKKRNIAEQMAEPQAAHDVMQPEIEPESKSPETDEDRPATEPETGNYDLQEKDDKPPGEGSQDGQQVQSQDPQPPPPTIDSSDGAQKTEGPTEDEKEIGGTEKIPSKLQEGTVDDTDTQEGKADETNDQIVELDYANQQAAEKTDGIVEDVTIDLSSKENVIKIKSEEFVEPNVPDDSPIRSVLGVGGQQSFGETEDSIPSSYPGPDVTETPLQTVDETVIPSEVPESAIYDTVPPSSGSEFSDRDDMNIEPSKDSTALVEELLGSSMDEKDTYMVDDQELMDINLIGKSVDQKTDMVLNELAEMIAATREEKSPLQEAIKDIMEKELEERLGDKDVETINEVAGKVGTWMDKMVERAAEEYGERRSPSRVRSVSLRPETLSKGSAGAPRMPSAVTKAPSPKAIPSPEGIAKSSFETARIPSPQPPVSQKPKGPIFELRKVDTKNIFNVASVTQTKAKRKIREARGQSSSSRHVSQESLDIEEWAEWAGLVSDVGRNWTKWIEDVAQGLEAPDYNNENRLSYDAKEWKNISKELQREGDVWMKKFIRKQNEQKNDQTPKTKPMSA